jgi:uncharacterized membrane protein
LGTLVWIIVYVTHQLVVELSLAFFGFLLVPLTLFLFFFSFFSKKGKEKRRKGQAVKKKSKID